MIISLEKKIFFYAFYLIIKFYKEILYLFISIYIN